MISAVALVWMGLVLGSQAPRAEPQQGDWEWLSAHRMEAFEALMPLEGQHSALVTFRSYRDLYQDVHEQYFRISSPAVDSFSATLVNPVGSSIQEQLLDLHMQDRAASFESVLSRVRVTEVEISENNCPEIRRRLQVLDEIPFRSPGRERIILHPMVYWISIYFESGTMLTQLNEDEHPLVVWAVDSMRDLERCGGRVGVNQ